MSMIEMCCQCDEGLGLWHVHRRKLVVRRKSDGLVIQNANGFILNDEWDVLEDYLYIKITVDWLEVARELARNA